MMDPDTTILPQPKGWSEDAYRLANTSEAQMLYQKTLAVRGGGFRGPFVKPELWHFFHGFMEGLAARATPEDES